MAKSPSNIASVTDAPYSRFMRARAEQAASRQADTALIQLGHGANRLDSADLSVQSSGFAALLPNAKLLEIAPACHVSFLPLCIEKGADRVALHAQVISAVKAHLGLN